MEHVLRRSTVVNRTVQVQALRDFAMTIYLDLEFFFFFSFFLEL